MRLLSTIMLLTIVSLSIVFAQTPLRLKSGNESYPIDGSHLLQKQEQQVRDYVKQHPEMLSEMRLSKTAAWNFNVGSTKSWYSQDLTTNTFYQVPSTCRKVGTHCYIFVEDAIWNSRVNQAAVDSVANYFDNKTPANPTKGIYQSDVEAFGDVPDVDSDPRIIILIEDIKDGYTGTGGYVAGYFTGHNETNQTYSNKAEIYYLDGNPGNLSTASGLRQAISTTAHEFQHMIFWKYHTNWQQATFIDEGCAELAEINVGFQARAQEGDYGYNNETNRFLMEWRQLGDNNTLKDYSRASRFFLYLRDQFGIGIFKKIVSSTKVGISCFNDAFAQMGSTLKLADVYTNFMLANIIDDRSSNPAYGYVYQNLPKPTGKVYGNPNASSSTTLYYLAGEYLTFNNGTDLKITFNSSSTSLKIKALESGPSGKRIVDVPVNAQFSEPEFGKGYTSVTFAVINPVESSENWAVTNYSFTSSGSAKPAMELKWDDSEPTTAYSFDPGDTIAVTFNAVPGGRLDSIKVALGSTGTITGGIWETSGGATKSPLGRKLAYPVTAVSTVNLKAPYPVPFSNWKVIDLRSYNITTDKAFVAGFVFGKNTSEPGIMVADHIGGDPYHSFTYFTPTGNPSDWYYLSSNTNSSAVAIYLVRAYVSFQTSDIKQTADIKPSNYKLSQNYPNPFNPVTTIRYQIPEDGFVTLKVYDMLGNEVSSLVSQEQTPGEYTATFDGKNLASGIYFYNLTQGNFTETKKLVLMK